MKKIICDKCQASGEIYFDQNGEQLCKECFWESSKHYKKTKLEEDYGVKLGKMLQQYRSFVGWSYDEDPRDIQDKLNKALKQFGIKCKHIDYDETDSYYFGFQPI